jgi:aspartate aminotransferase-like enzyme
MDSRLDQGRWLRIPGPTPLHPDVVKALPHEMVPIRGPQYTQVMERIQPIARQIHGTDTGRVILWAGTGTAGFEASIVNLLAPGDGVVVTEAGDFGHRYAQVAETFGLNVKRLKVEWGTAVSPDELEAAIKAHGDVKAVMITHNETSTGVTQPLQELAAVAKAHGALVLVDAVSSAAAFPIEMDAWGLDWVLSGVQKAWMCPPGLMVSAVSERALETAKKSTGFPRMIWDLTTMADASEQNIHPTTGPQSAIFALDAALQAMDREGVDNVFARHKRLGEHFRAGLERIGLQAFAAPGFESNSVTAFMAPGGSASAFQKKIREATGIEIAVGQGEYADKLNRIGTMGWVDTLELDATLEAIEVAAKSV